MVFNLNIVNQTLFKLNNSDIVGSKMRFPWDLLRGCWIILSYSCNAKQLLAAYFSLLLSKHKKVYLIKDKSFRNELLVLLSKNNVVKEAVLENIFLIQLDTKILQHNSLIRSGGDDNVHVLLYEPPFIPSFCSKNCIVLKTPPLKKKIKFCRTASLTHVCDQEYLLKSGFSKVRIVISPKYIGVSRELNGKTAKALDLLRRSIVDYGELTIKDAIEILAYNLGIKKDEARKILGLLVEKEYVKVDKKHIIVY